MGVCFPVSVHASRPSVSTQSTIPFLSLSSDTRTQLPKAAVGLPSAAPAQVALLQSRPPGVTVDLGPAQPCGLAPGPQTSSLGPRLLRGRGSRRVSFSLARSQSLGAPHVTPPCTTHWPPGPVLNLVFPFSWREPLGGGALESFPTSQLQSGHAQLIQVALTMLDLGNEGVGGMGMASLPFLPRASRANMPSQAWPCNMAGPPAWRGGPRGKVLEDLHTGRTQPMSLS